MRIEKDKKALDKLYRRRDRYDLQPHFQREEVWSETRQQLLLDTILKSWDIPKVYMRVTDGDSDSFECIDGQQRLNAIFRFYDNQLKLSKKSAPYGGLYYTDLPLRIRDIFDDYELDIELVHDATDDELGELFSRLQLGIPLNSAEKLNAISGNMKEFVKSLSELPFFLEKIPLKNKRYAYQSMCAQIALLEIEGIRGAKFEDLSDFYNRKKDFDTSSEQAKNVIGVLSSMNTIFKAKTSAFRNRASVISFYLLLSELIKKGLVVDEKSSAALHSFYIDFQQKLKAEIEKGAEATDTELIVYQSKVNQSADGKDSILKRHQILRRRLCLFDETFRAYLDMGEQDDETVELRKKDSLNQLAVEITATITRINKKNFDKVRTDVFKPTNDLLISMQKLAVPVTAKDTYSSFIDSAYKIFYEGSGALSRVPDQFKKDDSILFEIKHLRTELFHDIDHGKLGDVEKKKELIIQIHKKYIGKVAVDDYSEADFSSIQKIILNNIFAFLASLEAFL